MGDLTQNLTQHVAHEILKTKGVSFLGDHFGPLAEVSVRSETVSKNLERAHRLLEQQTLTKERLEKHVEGLVPRRSSLNQYVKYWNRPLRNQLGSYHNATSYTL